MRITHQQARADFEFLETIRELDDRVPVAADMDLLLEKPTKRKAAEIYCACIGLWFSRERMAGNEHRCQAVAEIARRYNEHL